MFYKSANGLQLVIDNGWTVSISLAGSRVTPCCEIAVWPIGYSEQENWVRWGANGVEPPDFPIHDRVLGGLTVAELLRVITRLSAMPVDEVEPDKWLSKGLTKEDKWR